MLQFDEHIFKKGVDSTTHEICRFRILEGVSLIIVWWRCEGFGSQIDRHRSSYLYMNEDYKVGPYDRYKWS